MVVESKTTLKLVSSEIGVPYRHGKRLKRKLVIEGARGLVHGNRGRPSARAFHPELAKRIIELSQKTYTAFNDTHFTEKLNEVEGITVSRDTVRRLRRSNGIKPKRKRRAKKHYQMRPRKAHEGMMVLWDGSPHRWFSKDKPSCCLMAAIDDPISQQAWRKGIKPLDIKRIIRFCYQAAVGNDNIVRSGGIVLDITEGPHKRGREKSVSS